MGMKQRGLSPVVATVLLVSLVVILSLIVFFFIRGLTEEAVTKDGTNVKIICQNSIDFTAEYSPNTGNLDISNTGNTPIYDFKVEKELEGGSSNTIDLSEREGWPKNGLTQGAAASVSVNTGVKKLIMIPVLLGQSESEDGKQKTYVCENSPSIKEI